MQLASTPPPVGKTAFRHGLNFGLLQVFFATIILLANTFLYLGAGLSLLLAILNFLLSLAAYFVAGILAAKETGRLNAGTYAGMWTGAIYGIINFAISSAIFFLVLLPRALEIAQGTTAFETNPDAFRIGAIIGGLFLYFGGAALAVGFGAGLGVLGGLIGRNKSPYQPMPAIPMYATYPPPPYFVSPVPYAPPLAPGQQPPMPQASQPAPAEQMGTFGFPNEAQSAQPGAQPYMEQPQ